MKMINRALVLVGALALASALMVAPARAAPPGFIGSWWSTDVDGSYQILQIGGGPGNVFHVRYYDFGATVCGVDPDTSEILYAASAQGALELAGGMLQGPLPVYCQKSPPEFYANSTFQFTPVGDTLVDSSGVTWYRK